MVLQNGEVLYLEEAKTHHFWGRKCVRYSIIVLNIYRAFSGVEFGWGEAITATFHISRLSSSKMDQQTIFGRLFAVAIWIVTLQTQGSCGKTVHLSDDYDRNSPPKTGPGGGPLMVNVSLDLESVYDVLEKAQMISVAIILRLEWNDTRVNVHLPEDDTMGYVLRTRDSVEDLWFPDVFVANTKDVRMPSFGISPQYLRIYPGGYMIHSSLSNFDLHCSMDFVRYPVDIQECDIVFESYSTVSHNLDLQWHLFEINAQKMNQHTFTVKFTRTQKTYMTGKF